MAATYPVNRSTSSGVAGPASSRCPRKAWRRQPTLGLAGRTCRSWTSPMARGLLLRLQGVSASRYIREVSLPSESTGGERMEQRHDCAAVHDVRASDSNASSRRQAECNMPILVCEGEVVERNVPSTAADLLRSVPSCPYTTTRSCGQRRTLLFWRQHMERLAHSARVMQADGLFNLDNALASIQMHELVQPSLEVALREAALHSETATSHELSVTVLLVPASRGGDRPGGLECPENSPPEGASTSKSRLNDSAKESWTANISFRSQPGVHLIPTDPVCGDEIARGETGADSAATSEIRKRVRVWVYVSRYDPPAEGAMPSGATVAVMGPGRKLAQAKDSSWALERRPLEAAKPAGVGEVLLSNDGEALLEGLLTNFFVVRRAEGAVDRASSEADAVEKPIRLRPTEDFADREASGAVSNTRADGSACEQESGGATSETQASRSMRRSDGPRNSGGNGVTGTTERGRTRGGRNGERGRRDGSDRDNPWKGLVLQTADVSEGVLPGVIRGEVLRLCKESGIPVILQAPNTSERETWVEAFITSSVRIVQPVVAVRWRPGWHPTQSGHVAPAEWCDHRLPAATPSLSRALWDGLLSAEPPRPNDPELHRSC